MGKKSPLLKKNIIPVKKQNPGIKKATPYKKQIVRRYKKRPGMAKKVNPNIKKSESINELNELRKTLVGNEVKVGLNSDKWNDNLENKIDLTANLFSNSDDFTRDFSEQDHTEIDNILNGIYRSDYEQE